MSAILEIPEVRQRVSRLSVQEYHQLGEFNENGRRTELIRGIVIEKISKSPPHRTIGSILYKLILAQLPPGFCVWKEEPLTFKDSEPEPDIAIVKGEESDFLSSHPTSAELVIEIAVSSVALDRENCSLYAEAGVKEYWIVLARRSQVEVYTCPKEGRYLEKHILNSTDVLQSTSLPAVRIPLSKLYLSGVGPGH